MSKQPHLFTWKDVLRVISGTESKYCDKDDYNALQTCIIEIESKLALFHFNCPQFKPLEPIKKPEVEEEEIEEIAEKEEKPFTPLETALMQENILDNILGLLDNLLGGHNKILDTLENFITVIAPVITFNSDSLKNVIKKLNDIESKINSVKEDTTEIKKVSKSMLDMIKDIVLGPIQFMIDRLSDVKGLAEKIFEGINRILGGDW